MNRIYSLLTLLIFCLSFAEAQQRIGINTTAPVRPLDIHSSGSQYLRLQSTTAFGSKAGIEFLRGDNASNARDWKIENASGYFKISTGTDNFSTAGEEALRINPDGYMGIGTNSPVTRLHVDNGEDASNTLDGYVLIGSKTGDNIVMDENEIMARQNGSSSTLYLQSSGGNTWFGAGNVYMGSGGGKVTLGDATQSGRFNVNGSNYQVQIRNPSDGLNDWFIGASDDSWQTGDDQLLFSPNNGHLNSTLRLMNVTDNNGFEAPVMITSPSTQTIYMDGNEIDSKTPLFINQNSNENTYINPSGGKVGVGTSNPSAALHMNTDEQGISLQRDFATWWITPTAAGNINFYKNTALLAYVSYNGGGEWVAVSDRNLKENIKSLKPMMETINQLRVCSYSFTHDPASKKDIGVIAQELEPLIPAAVSYAKDQYGVSYDQLTVVAIKGIQEQQSELEQLEKQIDSLLAKDK